ncbi:MAG TPA: flagellar hook-associated protein FlgK [Steroidobacteraceae bacterium]|jgi:flagellar hook-associated protein 1 FlgK|nr:flagellar hook-associated protein FlgK [Steroidobacteraceae bacterium]
MADLLSTSVSGLLAFQQALDVTSNNISNAQTPGYDVETANFQEEPGQTTGVGYIGSGVDISSITRAYDAYLAAQVNSTQASYSSSNTLATQAAQVDNMLSDSSTGLTATLQSFVNALQTAATTPTSTAARQALLSSGQALAQQIQTYSSQLSQGSTQLESQLSSDVNEVNSLSSNIATLNQQIAAASSNGATPNALLDQRDQLINQLSQYVSVQTASQGNNEVNVYIGSGQALVTGGSSQTLATITNAYDPSQLDIGVTSGSGSTADITSEVSGGALGGLLSARSQVLDPAINAIGQIAVGVATVVNQQQQSGMDLTGAPGQAMFSVGGVSVLPNSANAGSASLAVTRGNLSDLTTDNYELKYTGGTTPWQLTDATTGQSVTLSGSGTSTSPLTGAGLSIVVSGTPQAGDSFLVQPTAGAAAGFSMVLTSPSQVAAASLVQASAGSANTGTGTLSSAGVTDPSTWTSGTYTVAFSAGNAYTVTNSSGTTVANGSYTSGDPIDFNGIQLTLTGSPASGDTFTVSPNSTSNTGDNSNLYAMVNALSASALDNGTTSINAATNNIVSQIGTVTQQAQNNATTQQTANQNATTNLNNVSGVNLDQQAATMLQYQQAYQAMAEVIQVSGQLFNSLISAVSANGG